MIEQSRPVGRDEGVTHEEDAQGGSDVRLHHVASVVRDPERRAFCRDLVGV